MCEPDVSWAAQHIFSHRLHLSKAKKFDRNEDSHHALGVPAEPRSPAVVIPAGDAPQGGVHFQQLRHCLRIMVYTVTDKPPFPSQYHSNNTAQRLTSKYSRKSGEDSMSSSSTMRCE